MTASLVKIVVVRRRDLRWLRSLGCGLAALSVWVVPAQTGKPDLATVSAPGVVGSLGPLLLSPAQRKNLEAVRNLSGNEDEGVRALPSESELLILPEALVVSGVVVRSGNRSTVWVNGQPLYGQASVSSLRTLAGKAGVLSPSSKDMQLRVKPGQVIDVPSGQAVDVLPPGSIKINPPKLAPLSRNKE